MLLPSAPAMAKDEHGFQQWTTLSTDIALGASDSVIGNLIVRSRTDSLEPGLLIARVGWSHDLDDSLTMTLAYTYADILQTGPNVHQHRLSQGLTRQLGDIGGGRVRARLQAEEALVEGYGDEFGVRLRGKLQWTRTILPDSGVSLDVSEEMFVSINRTRWGQDGGFTGSRASIGLRFPIRKTLAIQPSYIWQYSDRDGPDDRHTHALGLTIDTRF